MSDLGNHHSGSVASGPDLTRRSDNATLSDRVRSLRLPAAMTAQPARGSWVPWILCLLFAGTTAFFAWNAFKTPAPPAPETTTASTTSESGTAPRRAAAAGEVVLESKGYVIPAHQIQVSPKVSGMIMELHFEEGQRVQKGDVLAKIETVDYLTDRDHAKAALESARQKLLELKNGSRPEEIDAARAEMAEAEAQRDQLYLDWKRNLTLKVGTAVAQRDYEQAYAAYKAMDRRAERLKQNYLLMKEGPRVERIAYAEADARAADEDLKKAEWKLDNCTIRAPISGTILTKIAEEGNIVNQFSLNLKGSLGDMADLSDLEVDLTIQERDIAKVFKDQECRIRAEAYPDRIYVGKVSRLMPIADRAKGAVPVRVKLTVPKEEEGVFLKPEMGAIVSFLKNQGSGVRSQESAKQPN